MTTETATEWLRTNCQSLLEAGGREQIRQQFELLFEQASQRGMSAASAREALCFILLNSGKPLTEEHRDWAQECAAGAINNLCKSSIEARIELVATIDSALTAGAHIPAKTRRLILGALMRCTGNTLEVGYHVSPSVAGEIVAGALQLEINRHSAEQDEVYLEELLFAVRMLKSRQSLAQLDVLAAQHASQRIRDSARAIASQLRDSVISVWDQTAGDPKLLPEQRVLKLAALRSCNDEKLFVQSFFSAVKGYDSNNPQDQVLHLADNLLSHHLDRVALSACLYFIESEHALNNRELLERLTFIVAEKSISLSELGLAADAAILLEKLKHHFADDLTSSDLIALAQQKATLNFLGANLL